MAPKQVTLTSPSGDYTWAATETEVVTYHRGDVIGRRTTLNTKDRANVEAALRAAGWV